MVLIFKENPNVWDMICLAIIYTWLGRGVFKTQSNICNEAFCDRNKLRRLPWFSQHDSEVWTRVT